MIERTLGSVIFVESEVFRSPSFAVFFYVSAGGYLNRSIDLAS